jgi:hypothetical protein
LFRGISGAETVEAMEDGRKLLLNAATEGFGGGRGTAPGTLGAMGGFGAAPMGGRGAELREVSGSDKYGESAFRPVSTPPAFLSLGIPPANRPPSCGPPLTDAVLSLAPSPPVSLLLLARLPPGTGGASPPGAFGNPGTGGAPPTAGTLGPSETLPTCGAERSLICVTLRNLAPFSISPSKAPYK